MRTVVLTLSLAVTWLLLSGHYNALLLVLGAVSCGTALAVYRGMDTGDAGWMSRLRPLPQLRYFGWLMVEIVKSNILVIGAILDSSRVKGEQFEVDTGRLDDLGKVIYANSITLTPGTVTMDIGEKTLTVHSLVAEARVALDSGDMLRRVEDASAAPGNAPATRES